MNQKQTNSKRLAKNAIYMYTRMFILMIISFYTSRVVLQQLGVEDFGIYNLVGSIVAMFNSLRAIFASSTQRFLNYEMGAGNEDKLHIVFNMSLLINSMIAVLFIVLVEIVGIWFFYSGINVPDNRIEAAFIVFQLSIITSVVSIISSVFDAVVISHERMGFYAFLYILESVMKLIIVFMLIVSPYDKLICYGFLYLLITLATLCINVFYCRKCFSEVRLSKCWNKEYLKKMTSFAGWNFFGNTSNALTQSGMNMLLNTFGGPVVNAARGVAFQLNSAMMMFLSNVGIVVTPFSIKLYAKQEFEKFYEMIFLSSKLFFTVQLCLVIPFIFCTYDLLNLWLTEVPEYSVIFLQLILIHSLIRALHSPLDTVFKATGNLKYYQIIEGILLATPLLFSYIALTIGADYYVVFVIVILVELLNTGSILLLLKHQISFNLAKYLRSVILPCSFLIIITVLSYIWFKTIGLNNLVLSLLCCAMLDIVVIVIAYICMLSQNEKHYIISIIKKS